MMSLKTRFELQRLYHVRICEDFEYAGKMFYTIYSADGCKWENGLSYRQLRKELKEYRDVFFEIHAADTVKRGA